MQNIFKTFIILSIFLVYVTCHDTEFFSDIVGRRRCKSVDLACESKNIDAKSSCIKLRDELKECNSSQVGRSCREKAYCQAGDKFEEDFKSGVSGDYVDFGLTSECQCGSYDKDLVVNRFLNLMENLSGYKH